MEDEKGRSGFGKASCARREDASESRTGQMLVEMPKAKGTQVKGGNTGGPIVVPPVNESKTLGEGGDQYNPA